MPTFTPGPHLTVDLRFLGPESRLYSSRLYCETTGSAITISLMNNIADAFFAKLDGPLAAILPDTCQFHSVRTHWLGTGEDWEGFSTDTPVAGTQAGGYHGEEVAVVIQRRTGEPGRSKRGRIYLPFVPIALVENSTLNTDGKTNYLAVANEIETITTHAGINMHARQPDFKNNVLIPVVQCRVLAEICSRRDRRNPTVPTIWA